MEQPVENRRGEDVVAEDGAPLARASSISQDAIGDRELEHFRIDVDSQPCPKCLQYVGGIQSTLRSRFRRRAPTVAQSAKVGCPKDVHRLDHRSA